MPKPVYRVYQTTGIHKSGVLVWQGARWTELAELSGEDFAAFVRGLTDEDMAKIIVRLVDRIRA